LRLFTKKLSTNGRQRLPRVLGFFDRVNRQISLHQVAMRRLTDVEFPA
jgi:hypothetical protein